MDRRRPALAARPAPVARRCVVPGAVTVPVPAAVRALVLVVAAMVLAACGAAPTDAVSSGGTPVTDAPRGTAPIPAVGSTAGPGSTGTAMDAAPATSAPGTTSTSTVRTAVPPSTAGTPLSPPTGPTGAAAGTPHPVATTSLPLVDSSRPTISRGRTTSSARALPTTVFYPSDGGGPYPLVVFAHGFEIGPVPYAAFCRELAAAGYVVAAPSFPLTDANAAGASLDRGDLPNQAADVSFVVTSVSAANGAGPLRGLVDGGRVGIVGHSDGADTALDTAYYPGRTDARIKAVAALSPDAMTGPGGSVGAGVPLLLQHGDRDSIVPYSNSRTVWGQVQAHRFFLTLTGADHLPPMQGAAPWAPVLEGVMVDFLDRYVAGRTSTDAAIMEGGARPGVSTIVVAG